MRKTHLEFLHLRRHAIDAMRKLWNPGLRENLEDHGELEYRRSAVAVVLVVVVTVAVVDEVDAAAVVVVSDTG